eukprot:TRINITY_DN5061_c0_g1_i1.p1 TRINITY_DN5061_c0_g1~~TRINITY_DN5061_c0_g1_i1.p1  ORF type:complete len:1654 (-),score=515.86 TRINITY_DN5061_c0_g1_i1:27-4988(-)
MDERVTHMEKVMAEADVKLIEELEELKRTHRQREAEASKAAQEALLKMEERVRSLEQELGSHAEKHGEALSGAHGKLEELREKHAKELDELKDTHSKLHDAHHEHKSESAKEAQEKFATIAERIAYLEQELGSHAEKHGEALTGAHGRLEELHEKVSERHALHLSMEERMTYLEKMMGDSAEKHAKELDELKDTHSKLHDAHHEHKSESAKEAQEKFATIEERIAYLEQELGSHAEKHGEALTGAHGKLQELHDSFVERHAHHLSMEERLSYVEKMMGDSAEKHAKELEALKDTHSKLHDAHHEHKSESAKEAQEKFATIEERIAYLEQELGSHAEKHGEALSGAHGKLQEMCDKLSERDVHHLTLDERVAWIEKTVGDTAENHEKELKELKDTHSELHNAHQEHKVESAKEAKEMFAIMQQRLAHLEQELGSHAERHGEQLSSSNGKLAELHEQLSNRQADHLSIGERVACLEKIMGDSADRHAKQLEELKDTHSKLHDAHREHKAESAKEAKEMFATVGERLAYLEQELSSHAERHGKQLSGTHDKLRELQEKLSDRQANNFSVDERVTSLEKLMGDSAERHKRHAKQLEELKDTHSKLHDAHREHKVESAKEAKGMFATMEERVAYLEQEFISHAEKHGEQLNGALRELQEKLSDRQAHNLFMDERVTSLEKMMGDSAERHNIQTKQLQELKDTHSKLHDAHHGHKVESARETQEKFATLEERLVYLEQELGSHAERHGEALTGTHGKLEELHEQLSERHAHHLSIDERLQCLEKVIGDSAETHARELEELKDTHSKLRDAHHEHQSKAATEANRKLTTVEERIAYLEQELGSHTERHDIWASAKKPSERHGHNSMHERVASVEKMMGDATECLANLKEQLGRDAESHGEELSGAHDKLAKLQENMQQLSSKVGGQADSLDDLRLKHTELYPHHLSMEERLTYMEKMMGDAVEKHAKEIVELRITHGKLQDAYEEQGRERETVTTVEERLAYLEEQLGSHAERHGKLEELDEKLGDLQGKLRNDEGHSEAIDMLQRSHAERHAHHVSMEERLVYIEKALGDSAEKHVKELEELKATHGRLENVQKEHGSSLEERLAQLEQEMGGARERLEDALGRISSCERDAPAIDDLRSAMDAQRVFLERQVDSVGSAAEKQSKEANAKLLADNKATLAKVDQMFQEKESRDVTFANMQGRLKYLEVSLGETAEKQERQTRALEDLKGVCGKITGDGRSQEQSHGLLTERLGSVEKAVKDSVEQAAVDHISERLRHVEKALCASALKTELETGHSKLEAMQDTVAKRLFELEKSVADLASKQESASKDKRTEALQQQHSELLRAREAQEARMQDQLTACQEALHGEQHARQTIERTQQNLTERVDTLQRRVWEVIDQRTSASGSSPSGLAAAAILQAVGDSREETESEVASEQHFFPRPRVAVASGSTSQPRTAPVVVPMAEEGGASAPRSLLRRSSTQPLPESRRREKSTLDVASPSRPKAAVALVTTEIGSPASRTLAQPLADSPGSHRGAFPWSFQDSPGQTASINVTTLSDPVSPIVATPVSVSEVSQASSSCRVSPFGNQISRQTIQRAKTQPSIGAGRVRAASANESSPSTESTATTRRASHSGPSRQLQCGKCGNFYMADSNYCRKCGEKR